MQTKRLCVLIHIWTKGEAIAPLNWSKPSSKIFYWPFQGGTTSVDLLCFFCLIFAFFLYAAVYMCLVVTCWERADLLALVCDVLLWVCYFPIGIQGQVWYLIVSIPDLCTLTYFWIFTRHFSHICTRVMALNLHQNFVSIAWELTDILSPNFIYAFNLTRSSMELLHYIYRKFVPELWPFIYAKSSFPLNVVRTN